MNTPETMKPAVRPSRTRRRVKNALAGGAILLCGMVIGSALTAHFGHQLMLRAIGNPQRMAEHLTRRLTRELDLTPDQTEKVRAVISARAQNITAVFHETKPRLGEQFDLMHDEVSQVLTPEQKIKWDKHYERMKKRFDERTPP